MPKIEKIYAYVATEAPGDEGILAMFLPGTHTWFPLVGADMERINSLKPYAEKVARQTNKRVVLAEFSVRKDLEVIHT